MFSPRDNIDFSEKGRKEIELKVFKGQEEFTWGTIDTIDIVPDEMKTDIPVFFAPGWSITIDSIEKPLKELAKQKRRVVSLSHARIDGSKEETEELRKAVSLLSILERKQIEKTDAIGYSEGAINLLLVARQYPEKFNNIVLLNPAGLTGGGKINLN